MLIISFKVDPDDTVAGVSAYDRLALELNALATRPADLYQGTASR